MTTFELRTTRSVELPGSVCVHGIVADARHCEDEEGSYVEYASDFGERDEHEYRITVWCDGLNICIKGVVDEEYSIVDTDFDPMVDDMWAVFDGVCITLTEYIEEHLGE